MTPASFHRDPSAATRHARAWLAVAGALALHVVDEALTGFLEFYNPLVLSMRERIGWFPVPVFSFGIWLSGLLVLVLILFALTPAVRAGRRGTRAASWFLSALMFLNGVGHLAGSAYFGWWLPGATSAPLLLVTSVLLARAAYRRV